jgi:hypothetical protein
VVGSPLNFLLARALGMAGLMASLERDQPCMQDGQYGLNDFGGWDLGLGLKCGYSKALHKHGREAGWRAIGIY